MRLIHTADWHLGDRLGTVDRTEDQFKAVDAILGHCDEQKADVLLVAGDVFNDYHGENLARVVRMLAQRLLPRLKQGMNVLFIPGNHDRAHLFLLLETVQRLSGEEAAQRLRFVSRPRLLPIPDPSGSFSVQFVLAPYPTPDRYFEDDTRLRSLGVAERRQLLARAFADKLAAARRDIAPSQPSVLVTHVYVRGAETPTLFRMTEEDDVPIEPQDLPPWSYIALGHIHRAQSVGNRPAVRYSGSPDRLDLGERNEDKSCVLVEIRPEGLVEEPVLLPLPATPIYTVSAGCGDDPEALAAAHPDRDRALVHLKVTWQPGVENPAALISELRRLFPRHFKLEQHPLTERPVSRLANSDPTDMGGTVRAFLAEQLAGRSEQDRLRLMALAEEIVEEVRGAAFAD